MLFGKEKTCRDWEYTDLWKRWDSAASRGRDQCRVPSLMATKDANACRTYQDRVPWTEQALYTILRWSEKFTGWRSLQTRASEKPTRQPPQRKELRYNGPWPHTHAWCISHSGVLK